jgi:copper(I)-binding protein
MMSPGPQRKWLLIATLLLAGCGSSTSGLQVDSAWARPAGRGMNSAAYLMIRNGPDPDVLTGAASEAADIVQIHRTVLDENGTARMEEQPRLTLGPGQILEMKPGGIHIMLIDLRQPLLSGETFDITLYFEQAGEYHASVPVGNN